VSKGAMSDNAAVLSEDHYVSDAARHAITEGYANQCPLGSETPILSPVIGMSTEHLASASLPTDSLELICVAKKQICQCPCSSREASTDVANLSGTCVNSEPAHCCLNPVTPVLDVDRGPEPPLR
jgi:hypothetical protein